MGRFERICPECGASNSYSVANCVKCRAPLTGGTAQQSPPPAGLFSRRMVAGLAWRATKFLARKGFNIAKDGAKSGIERVQNRNKQDVKSETIDGNVALREWRVHSAKPEPEKKEKTERVTWGPKK